MNQNDLTINNVTRTYLTEIHKWAKFFVIMGIIAIVFMVLGGISLLLLGIISSANPYTYYVPGDVMGGTSNIILGVVYIILAGLYILPTIYLNRFSNSLKIALGYSDNSEVETAFLNLKSVFKYYGIMTIVLIGLYIFAIIGFVLFMAFSF